MMAARGANAPPEALDLMKKHQLDDLDIMGMLQVADSPGGDGPESVLRTVGNTIVDPRSFILDAREILGARSSPLSAPSGEVVILKTEGDRAVGQIHENTQGNLTIHFERDAAGWRLALPPELESSKPDRSFPTRERRNELRAAHERQEQLRRQNDEVHEMTFAAAWLFGQTSGKFEMLATGEDRRRYGGGVVMPIYIRFEGGDSPIYLPSLSEAEAAYFLEVPYADRELVAPEKLIKRADPNGFTRYSNHQGTDAKFQFGQLVCFISNSPFIEYSVVREGPAYTLPMTLEQAQVLFGHPVSRKSDRDAK